MRYLFAVFAMLLLGCVAASAIEWNVVNASDSPPARCFASLIVDTLNH
jgi:hypothetical protein